MTKNQIEFTKWFSIGLLVADFCAGLGWIITEQIPITKIYPGIITRNILLLIL